MSANILRKICDVFENKRTLLQEPPSHLLLHYKMQNTIIKAEIYSEILMRQLLH